MKIRKISLVIIALAAFGVATAQNPTQGSAQGKTARNKTVNHQQGEKVFRNAIQEIEKGMRDLKGALHIYDGHRAEAIQYGAIAIGELRIGRIENRQQSAQRKESDNEDRRKYSDDQIRKSNAKLVEASGHYERALVMLQKTTGDYNGHKVNAMQNLKSGIQQIQLALKHVGSQINP
ncbi:MAG: hypothetical protein WCK51_02570 [Armatimonadota bacterium]